VMAAVVKIANGSYRSKTSMGVTMSGFNPTLTIQPI
jgi:hypothetical protein